MKIILLALLICMYPIPATSVEDATISDTASHDALTSHGFQYIVPSAEQKKALDIAYKNMKLEKQTKSQTRNIDQALSYLWRTINIAVITTPRVCTEYRNFFWFSRLDSAGPDDQTFKSGFAVKKGTGEIYRWEE